MRIYKYQMTGEGYEEQLLKKQWILVMFYQGPARKSKPTPGMLMKRLTKWVLEVWKGKREPRGNYLQEVAPTPRLQEQNGLEVSEKLKEGVLPRWASSLRNGDWLAKAGHSKRGC